MHLNQEIDVDSTSQEMKSKNNNMAMAISNFQVNPGTFLHFYFVLSKEINTPPNNEFRFSIFAQGLETRN